MWGPAGPRKSGSEELQEEKILAWILVLNLWWAVKVWRVLFSLSWWSWQEATRSMSSLGRVRCGVRVRWGWRQGQQPLSCSSQPAPGRARGGEHGTQNLSLGSPSVWGPQPHALFPPSGKHPGEAGTHTEDPESPACPGPASSGALCSWQGQDVSNAQPRPCRDRQRAAAPCPQTGDPRTAAIPQPRGSAALGVPEMHPTLTL